MAIGKVAGVKINANIGTSAVTSDLDEELDKLRTAIRSGADTVMDLSTGRDLDRVREAIIAASPVPIGTVPIYQAVIGSKQLEELTAQDFIDGIELQARQGVDYMTQYLCADSTIPRIELRYVLADACTQPSNEISERRDVLLIELLAPRRACGRIA
ncbi:hypothetical protein BH23GEM2_BH23GEM2_18390 [soil metagenome]